MSDVAVEQAMENALGHHQAGRLAEAEAIYRQVLACFPDHADALHLLGVLACQSGHTAVAIDLIGRAIALNPAAAEYHNNLGNALKDLGRRDEAIHAFQRAVQLRPENATAHTNLGTVLWEQGRLGEAIDAYRRAIQLNPGSAATHTNLGNALCEQGRLGEAIDACRQAIVLKPDLAEAHNNLGNALKGQGRHEEAADAYRRAIALSPGLAVPYNNLGTALGEQGRLGEAIDAYQRAIQLSPGLAGAHSNLGSALREQGRLGEAIDACQRAIALKPGLAEAHVNLGNVLKDLRRRDEAMDWYQRAIQLSPGHAEAPSSLGTALWEQGRLDEASAACRRAIALKPGLAEAHNTLGCVFKEQGRLDEASAAFRTAATLKPDHPRAASNLLLTLHYHPEHDARSILEAHRLWARQYAAPLATQIQPHPNDPTPGRRLKLGYVSRDFRDHAVGHLLLPLFSHHDPHETEIHCYSDVRAGDAVTEKLRSLADRWRSTPGLSDPQLAELIRTDRIDILVDLALHTANNRLLVFARKPAPVQVTMLGMPATTGLATMDYRLTDPYLDPPGTSDSDYSEQSIRLPHCYWCYHPPEAAAPVGPLPAPRNGFITFGCLNQFTKMSRPALELWAKILQALPAARLVLLSHPGSHLDAARGVFQAAGIGGERVAFAAPRGRDAYLGLYHQLDLSLDPFPYNGHTTTLDSLGMGVPVITLEGRTAVGRGGVSILSNAGLPEFIARTPEEYVAIAVEWARDRARLAALRAGLRQRMAVSPLMDGQQYAADVETAFRGMWKRWCGV